MAKAGEVWAVTGSSKGIGLAYVTQVLEAGASAVALVRSPKTSHGLQELHTTYGDALTIVAMDVGVFSSIQDAAAAVEQAHPGGIDVLVANAGMGGVSDLSTLNIDLDPAEFDETFHINVTGAFATIKYFYPLLKKKVGGRKLVVTMSSIGGCMGQTASEARELQKPLGFADGIFMAYKASKAALNQVTVQLAQSLKAEGFTLIAMHPGLVETDLAGPLITRIQGAIGEEATASFKLSPEVSVRSQLQYLASVTQEKDNARFVDYSGKEMPW